MGQLRFCSPLPWYLRKDVVKGYEIGANNYIKKPFIPEELDAHVHALSKLSKGEKSKDTSQCYKIGKEYVLDATHATLKTRFGCKQDFDCARDRFVADAL